MRRSLILSLLAALPVAVSALAEPDSHDLVQDVGANVPGDLFDDKFAFTEQELNAVEEDVFFAENSTELVRRQSSTGACPRKGGIHIVAGPGAGGTGPEDYGYLSSTVLAVQRAIPGSNNFCLGPYQGSNGLFQTENAQRQLRVHLEKYHKRCPNAPVAVIGYSTGAIGAMNLICGSSPAPPWTPSRSISKKKFNIFALTTYGDETRKKGMPYNRGTCGQNAPKYPRKASKGCKGFWPQMRAWCDKADGDCCAGGINGGPAHFAYPNKYNGKVVKFIKAQFKKYKKQSKKQNKN